MMLKRWRLEAYPVACEDPTMTEFTKVMASVINAEPETFFTRRGAHRAARFHTSFLPVALEVVRRDR